MKKYMFILIALLLTSIAVGNTYHEIEFKDDSGNKVPNASIQSIKILIPGSTTNATIHVEKSKTNAITQPITASSTNTTLVNSVVRWWGDDGYDIIVTTINGMVVNRRGSSGSDGSLIIPKAVQRRARNVEIEFQSQPVCTQEDGTTASGTDTEINVGVVDGGNIIEYINIGTQTLLVPNIVATGLDISRDLTDDEGTEYGMGILAGQPGTFTVGTDAAFFIRATITITDVSGTDDFLIGFRKAEAYQSGVDDYDEMAAFNVISGNLNTETIINAASTVTTDTTINWADTTTKELQVNVSDAGVVTYDVNGVVPATVAAFTFDDAEVVVPFIYFLHAANVAESTIIQELEVGNQ